MNRTKLKSILFATVACFFLVNATAQKSSKMKTEAAKKSEAVQTAEAKKAEEAKEKENFKYEYAVVTLEGKPGAYHMNMKDDLAKEKKLSDPTLLKAQHKMQQSGGMQSEAEILNFLTDLGYELVTVIPLTGERGMGVKYYLRKKVKLDRK